MTEKRGGGVIGAILSLATLLIASFGAGVGYLEFQDAQRRERVERVFRYSDQYAAQADSAAVWPYALAAMSLLSFAAWIGNYRRLRHIADTPTSRVASALAGSTNCGSAALLPVPGTVVIEFSTV